MKTLTRSLLLLAGASCAFAQVSTLSSNLASAITATSFGSPSQWCLVSGAGVVLPSIGQNSSYFVVDSEAVQVTGAGATSSCFKVKRGQLGTSAAAHNSGANVWIGTTVIGTGDSSRPLSGVFLTNRPSGACNSASYTYLPLIVVGGVQGGEIINCTGPVGQQLFVTANLSRAVNVGIVIASAATIAPTAFVTHVSGTAAIVNITTPPGLVSGSFFTIIPDGAFTTTTAGNIGAVSTAIVGKPMTFTYDAGAGKFYPSY